MTDTRGGREGCQGRESPTGGGGGPARGCSSGRRRRQRQRSESLDLCRAGQRRRLNRRGAPPADARRPLLLRGRRGRDNWRAGPPGPGRCLGRAPKRRCLHRTYSNNLLD